MLSIPPFLLRTPRLDAPWKLKGDIIYARYMLLISFETNIRIFLLHFYLMKYR